MSVAMANAIGIEFTDPDGTSTSWREAQAGLNELPPGAEQWRL
jgi:hypothetical protein